MQIIGRINRAIYQVVAPDITTDEIIITQERVQHVLDRHPEEAHGAVFDRLLDAVRHPDYILDDPAPNTAVVLKQYPDLAEQYRIIVRLHAPSDPPEYKNSVITAFYISRKTFTKYVNNQKIVYKRE